MIAAALKRLFDGRYVAENGEPMPEWYVPELDGATPLADRDSALHQATASTERERDKAVAELQRQIDKLQRTADVEIAKLHSDAQIETELLAAKLARNEFSALVPIIERVIVSSGTDLPALRELSETYERLEARSRKLLPVIEGAGGSTMARGHRLWWAVAQAVHGGDPVAYPFVRSSCDGFGGTYSPADAVSEQQLIAALATRSATGTWRAMICCIDSVERLMREAQPVPEHWDIKARLRLLRFGGLPEVIDREIRKLKHIENEPKRREAERLSAEHAAEFDRTHIKRSDGTLTIIEPREPNVMVAPLNAPARESKPSTFTRREFDQHGNCVHEVTSTVGEHPEHLKSKDGYPVSEWIGA